MASKPLIVPEPFSGESSWSDWLDHFESVAAVNKWKDEEKLLWLRARMTGRAQKAYKNLPNGSSDTYDACTKALHERFEPDSKRDLYSTEFYSRKKRKAEDWASFAEDLKTLAERAFANLQDAAREHLVLTHYLEQIDNPQVAFSVRQKRPKSVDEAVTTTLEMESYLIVGGGRVGQVDLQQEHIVAAVQTKQDALMSMMQTMMERLEKLETKEQSTSSQQHAYTEKTFNHPRCQPTAIPVCFKCGREGHIARGCRARDQGK